MKKLVLAIIGLLLSVQLSAKELGRIRVLTYNVFGVLIAPDRAARMEKIGEEIAKINPDIIGFQEAFEARHRKILLQSLEKNGWGKPYQFYQKKWYGPGAWIVSKYPLADAKMLVYPVNGTLKDSDYYAQKGVAYAKVMTPFGPLDFFTTHLIARYAKVYDQQGNLIEDDWIKTDRLLQAEQIAWFVQNRNRASSGRSVVAVGDFNSPPVLLEYGLFKSLSGLNNVADELPIINCTAQNEDCKLDQRIDHIFYSNYPGSNGFYLKPVKTELVFYEKVKTGKGELMMSDHNALLTEFAALTPDDPEAKIGDRDWAKVMLLDKNVDADLPRLEKEVSAQKLNIADPAWQVFSVKMLDLLNAEQDRKNKIPTALAKIITFTPGRESNLSGEDYAQLEKALKLWEEKAGGK